MTNFLFALLILGSLFSREYAHGSSGLEIEMTVSPADKVIIPKNDVGFIEDQIRRSLLRETGLKDLKNFVVVWSQPSIKCIATKSEMDPTLTMGVCTVRATAFGVSAETAIVKKAGGYDISIIYAAVE